MDAHLNLSQYATSLKYEELEDGKAYFYDPIRKKHVRALPEEMVRQLCIYYMVNVCNYPIKHIQVERSIKIEGVKRRYDIIVFDRKTNPFLLVECKAHTVKISQDVFNQVALYNTKQQAPYLWVSNGRSNFISRLDKKKEGHQFLDNLPKYR